jgi:hypothetical protein
MSSEQPRASAQAIADFFRGVTGWRREMAKEYARDIWSDPRSAEGLVELADYVESLPDDDERLRALESMAVRGGIFNAGSLRASQLLSSFRVNDPSQDCDEFLSFLVRDIDRFLTERGQIPRSK